MDVPIELRPGIMHREADYHGNARWYAVDPTNPDRATKGDLPMDPIKDFDPRPLTHAGLPFKNLKG